MTLEWCFSDVLPAFSLPEKYAVNILSPTITILIFFEETISLQ